MGSAEHRGFASGVADRRRTGYASAMRLFGLFILSVLLSGCGSQISENAIGHADHETSTIDHSKMDHSMIDHSSMESSPGAKNAPVDLQFIDTMIVHHQGAVTMAKLADGRAETRQFRIFVSGMITAQEREIAEMMRWRSDWFKNAAPAINMDFPGMTEGMKGMDLKNLKSLSGREFEVEFIRQMIPHHEGALMMSTELKKRGKQPKLIKLADAIIKDQTAEIEQMKKWLAEWER
jgi:uncharacterized protein (DUF305 family)